jgi:hypothetical protein
MSVAVANGDTVDRRNAVRADNDRTSPSMLGILDERFRAQQTSEVRRSTSAPHRETGTT